MTGWNIVFGAGSLLVSLIVALGAIWYNRSTLANAKSAEQYKNQAAIAANDSANFATAAKDLIDQYQEANEGLRGEVHECKGECAALREEVQKLRAKVEEVLREKTWLEVENDNLQAQLIQYKRRAGEL